MLVSYAVAFLAVALPALANHNRRNHAQIAKRMDGDLTKRTETFTGRMTWYGTDTGADACTGKNHKSTDWFIAMNIPQFEGSCGKQVRISYGGKSTVATVTDECGTCFEEGQIDATEGLFSFFASPDEGIIQATWDYVDEEDSDPTTTHHTTTEHKTSTTLIEAAKVTHKSSSTHHSSSKASSTSKKTSSTHKASSTSSTISSTATSSTATSSSSTATTTADSGVANAGGDTSGSDGGDTSGIIQGGLSSSSSNGAVSQLVFSHKAVAALVILIVSQLL